MKGLIMNQKSIWCSWSALGATSAIVFAGVLFALPSSAFTISANEVVIQMKGRNGVVESCMVPRHFDESREPQLEKDRVEEAKLCRMTLNSDSTLLVQEQTPGKIKLPKVGKEYATCPKLNSTNPGTNFVEIPDGWSREKTEATLCEKESSLSAANSELLEVEAKFKSSITCSYTPAALGGYHISRLLGNVGRAPVAVLRTLDRGHHEAVVKKAESVLGITAEIISKAWQLFKKADFAAAAGNPNPKLYVENGALIYGGLQKNLQGEEKYTEISGVGPYETRYERFVLQPPFKRVSNAAEIAPAVVGKAFAVVHPTLSQMKEVSDLVLFDVLLSQDDRSGNIHYKVEVREVPPNGGIPTARKMTDLEKAELENLLKVKKSKKVSAEELAELSARLFPAGNAILVRALYLKDNDCGVDVDKRVNNMRVVKALEQVRHMSGETYSRFLRFADDVLSDRFKTFALETLLYRAQDYEGHPKSLKENVKFALQTLKANCRAGVLKLDLDVSYSTNGLAQSASPVSCE